jgi:hypothetical protein
MEILFAGFRKKIGTDSPTPCVAWGHALLSQKEKVKNQKG